MRVRTKKIIIKRKIKRERKQAKRKKKTNPTDQGMNHHYPNQSHHKHALQKSAEWMIRWMKIDVPRNMGMV